MRKAIYSGSFDPFTVGHLDIVKQACDIFDEVHIVIAVNVKKKRSFNKELMMAAIEKVLAYEGITNAKVCSYNGLIADYCIAHDIKYSVRGLRNNMDYNYEENISEVNRLISPNLTTIYLRAKQAAISSSMVKEIFDYKKDISNFVPIPVLEVMYGQS